MRIRLALSFLLLATAAALSGEPGDPTQPPLNQTVFAQIVDEHAREWEEASNAITRHAVRKRRGEDLCSFGTSYAESWSGEVVEVTSDRAGRAGLTLRASDRITIKTFYGLFGTDYKPSDHPLHAVIASLSEGDLVRFSGTFYSFREDRQFDCWNEFRFTERATMTDPEFMFIFDDIRPQ